MTKKIQNTNTDFDTLESFKRHIEYLNERIILLKIEKKYWKDIVKREYKGSDELNKAMMELKEILDK